MTRAGATSRRFPGATNAPSNALCRKFGFELLEEVDVDYGGRALRCNRWVHRAEVDRAPFPRPSAAPG